MEAPDKGKRDGYMRNRYAASGHPQRQGSYGHVYSRFGASNIILCRSERTGQYTQTAGGGKIAAAKARGVKFGRPPRPLPENFNQIRLLWRDKKITLSQAAEACKMPKGTFYSKAVQYESDVQEKNIKQFEMVYFSKLHI